MHLPTQLDARIDWLLAVVSLLAVAPIFAASGRLGAGARLGARVLAGHAAWIAAWTFLPGALPPVSSPLAWLAVWVGGFALSAAALGLPLRNAAGGLPQRAGLASVLAFGVSVVWIYVGAVPAGFQAAGTRARLAVLESGDVPVVAAAELGAAAFPVARLVGGGCRRDVAVAWQTRSANQTRTTTWWAVTGADWTADQPIGAWTAQCDDGPWDLVTIEQPVSGRLASEAGAWKRAPSAVVVTAITPGELTAAGYTASTAFRSLLLAAVVAGLAGWRLFDVRPGVATASVGEIPSPPGQAPITPPLPRGKAPRGPGWPTRRR